MTFVSDTYRCIIAAGVYIFHHRNDHDLPRDESYVFVVDIEDTLAKVPSSSNPEQRSIEWEDFRSSVAMFSYSTVDRDQYRIVSRHSCVWVPLRFTHSDARPGGPRGSPVFLRL